MTLTEDVWIIRQDFSDRGSTSFRWMGRFHGYKGWKSWNVFSSLCLFVKSQIEFLFDCFWSASWCKLYCCHANQSDKTHQKLSYILTNQRECNLQSQFAPTSKLIVIWLVWKFIQSSQTLWFFKSLFTDRDGMSLFLVCEVCMYSVEMTELFFMPNLRKPSLKKKILTNVKLTKCYIF